MAPPVAGGGNVPAAPSSSSLGNPSRGGKQDTVNVLQKHATVHKFSGRPKRAGKRRGLLFFVPPPRVAVFNFFFQTLVQLVVKIPGTFSTKRSRPTFLIFVSSSWSASCLFNLFLSVSALQREGLTLTAFSGQQLVKLVKFYFKKLT